jgi:hypothetical protein
MPHLQLGELARQNGYRLTLSVLRSRAGYYIGTFDPQLGPVTRESEEYWPNMTGAERALATGEWTQRDHL